MYDVIVLGLGAMGSSTAYHLARRGKSVLGLEQFAPAHDLGSSHGGSRITRQAVFEDPAYVPLALRSYELWRELEQSCGEQLLFENGCLLLGSPSGRVVAGTLQSAREYDLPYELLDAADMRKRFPTFNIDDGEVGLLETRGGYLKPERAVSAQIDGAARAGAHLRFGERVVAWEASPAGEGVTVRTSNGAYEAGSLVIAAGAWAPQVLADLDLPLQVERQLFYRFAPTGGIEPFLPDRHPTFVWESLRGETVIGFPALDGPAGGVKTGLFHARGVRCTADTVDRTVRESEIRHMRDTLSVHIPALDGPLVEAKTCLYTVTPDLHFVLSLHSEHQQVVIASPCSGHGFKFTPAIGEALADLATDRVTAHDIAVFAPQRLRGMSVDDIPEDTRSMWRLTQ